MKPAILSFLDQLGETKIDFNFDRSLRLNSLFYKKLPIITVCGTNGKGSTCMFLESMLLQAGYRLGTFTSPHVENVRERIRIQGESISESMMEEFGNDVRKKMESENLQATYFEFLTFLALDVFERNGIEIAIFETGLGGRLDSTHAIPRIGAILTSVSMDHMSYLGDTLTQIAGEKIPILEASPFSVVSKQVQEVEDVIIERLRNPYVMEGREFHHSGSGEMFVCEMETIGIGPLSLSIRGDHQTSNAACAFAMAQHLRKTGWDKIDLQSMSRGLQNAFNPARLEKWVNRLQQEIWLDVAHNEDAIAKQVQYFYVRKHRNFHTVFGCSNDKPYESMIESLKPITNEFHFVTTPTTRSWKPEHLLLQNPVECVKKLIESRESPLFCTGSFYHVGEIRSHLPEWGFSKI